jgi:hypothetical protein
VKISSSDRRCWINIERAARAHSHAAFAVEVSVQIDHGEFRARNSDIHWVNAREFSKDLDKFMTDRGIHPRLNGTYDSVVGFSGSATSVILEFALGDAFRGDRTHQYLLRGSFDVEQDRLLSIIDEFVALIKEA